MAGMKVDVHLVGFKETIALLKGNELIREPWTRAMTQIGQSGAAALRAGAPRASGQTGDRATYRVQAKPIPNYTVIRTTAVRDRFSYPRVQEFSPYAYQGRKRGRNGRRIPPRGVNRNRGWFTKIMKNLEPTWARLLDKAADEMEKIWSR